MVSLLLAFSGQKANIQKLETSLSLERRKQEKKMEKKLIERMVRKCMNHLKSKGYELGITKRDVEAAVKCMRVVDKDWCGGATYAGSKVIQINLSYWQHGRDGWHKEYDAGVDG